MPLLQRTRPALTTIRQDTEAIGAAAAKKLIELVEHPEVTFPEIETVPCCYLPGQTLAAPNHE